MMVLLLLASLAAAQGVDVEREELRLIGWNDACSAAVSHLAYPKLGQAMIAEPVLSRVGTVTIPPGGDEGIWNWNFEASGPHTWQPRAVERVERSLRELGYTRPGFPEDIPTLVADDQPGLAETFLSTRTLSLRVSWRLPGPEWRWTRIHFNPLGTCALLSFEGGETGKMKRFVLVRVFNPRARMDRARAHASHARLLLNRGELQAALAEARNAAALFPRAALNRYVHAQLLSLTGDLEKAVAELAEAIKLDPSKRKDAKRDRDFDNLRTRDDFRVLLGAAPRRAEPE